MIITGGGGGMIMKPEPIFNAVEAILNINIPHQGYKDLHRQGYPPVILLTPQGRLFTQPLARNLVNLHDRLLLICGRYEGVDERVRQYLATDEISIGNFVLTGGELPALIIIDAVIRLIPGVLNDSEAALDDSFQDGPVVEAPYYTRPAEYRGLKVPDVLLSGNDKEIKKWKKEKSKSLTEKWREYNNKRS